MPVSPYFNHNPKKPTNEQLLMEDLLNEQIYIMGQDVYYILRETLDEIDYILGEDVTSIFQKAYKVGAYVNDAENWSDGSENFSKFGLFINKQNSIVITRRMFNRDVGNLLRETPSAGDLIYIPTFEKLFEIKKVSSEGNFFALGNRIPYYFTLDIEMFKYSHESIDTGIEELDVLEPENAYVINLHLSGGNSPFWINEVVYQGANLAYSTASARVKEWDAGNNVVAIYSTIGVFESNVSIKGDSSNVSWNIAGYDPLENNEEKRSYNNQDFQVDANTRTVTTEINPFGGI